MEDDEVLGNISALVEEEHRLRAQVASGGTDEDHRRLQRLEERLDQCWDLLRQRRAREHAGHDPDDAAPRPATEVEGYLQ